MSESEKGWAFRDWPVRIRARRYPYATVVFIRNNGRLVCTNLCAYDCKKYPSCADEAEYFEVPMRCHKMIYDEFVRVRTWEEARELAWKKAREAVG